MKNASTNPDGSINVSDLEGNHRYRYHVCKDSTVKKVDILCEGKIYSIIEANPVIVTVDGYPFALPSRYIEYLVIDQTNGNEDSSEDDAIVVNPMYVDFEDDIVEFTKSLIIAENIIDAIDRFSQIYDKVIDKEEVC
jgi:hypothetical protein